MMFLRDRPVSRPDFRWLTGPTPQSILCFDDDVLEVNELKAMNAKVAVAAIGISLLSGGCASSNPPRQESPSAVSGMAVTSPAPRLADLADRTLTDEDIKAQLAQGYKPVSKRGQIFYCRRERETGSHFDTMTCRTSQQIKEINRLSKDMLLKQQTPGGCQALGTAC